MRGLELGKIKEISRVIQDKRIDMAVGLINSVTPLNPEEPPVTRETIVQTHEQVMQELRSNNEHVLVDFSLKHGHNV